MKKPAIEIFKTDTDPAVHQIAKLVLTSLGGWVAAKLIETAYNVQFGLLEETDTEKENNA